MSLKFNGEDFVIVGRNKGPKFKVGEIVLYQNGSVFELGEVKLIITKSESSAEASNTKYQYRVWYHTGDTTALTDEYLLHKITNAYAFKIKRLLADDPGV